MFLEECCVLDAKAEVLTSAFRDAYEGYCQEVGEGALNATALGVRLGKHGIVRGQQTGGNRARIYRGVRLT